MSHYTKSRTIAVALAGVGVLLLLAAGVGGQEAEVATQEPEADARKAKILANLQVHFEQLRDMELSITELRPSGLPGLDEGILISQGRQQLFLVSADDTRFYLVAGPPIDVSRSAEEVAAELKKHEEEKAREAVARRHQLDETIADRPLRGSPDAPVTIVEFSDFQCPYCSRGATTMEQVLEKYPEDVKFAYLHYPLDFHPWAEPSAIAAHCAAQQDEDAFWKLHDAYFANQGEFNQENVLDKSRELLTGTDVDVGKWAVCAEDTSSEAYASAKALVEADMKLGKELGVNGTPGFFVNGRLLSGAQPLAAFESAIAEAKSDPKL
jgi:protein-disulfide isomerase